MTTRVFYGGQPAASVDPNDRGLAYGDGLFETLRCHAGEPVWWCEHWQRLMLGAERLGIALPNSNWVREQATALMTGDGVLKVILTRGVGGRGYAPPSKSRPGLILSRHALPAPSAGLRVRWCQGRLAENPALAGIKHLNRLEQVLARAEWDNPDIDEGLLCDTRGRVISAISGNLFVRIDGQWLTPALDHCGIAGVCRAWLLDNFPVRATELSVDQVENSQALFVCNSVRGILPVVGLGASGWPPDVETLALQRALARSQPAFVIDHLESE